MDWSVWKKNIYFVLTFFSFAFLYLWLTTGSSLQAIKGVGLFLLALIAVMLTSLVFFRLFMGSWDIIQWTKRIQRRNNPIQEAIDLEDAQNYVSKLVLKAILGLAIVMVIWAVIFKTLVSL